MYMYVHEHTLYPDKRVYKCVCVLVVNQISFSGENINHIGMKFNKECVYNVHTCTCTGFNHVYIHVSRNDCMHFMSNFSHSPLLCMQAG